MTENSTVELEALTAELSDIADQLDSMGDAFNSKWPIEMSDRVRSVAMRLINGSRSHD